MGKAVQTFESAREAGVVRSGQIGDVFDFRVPRNLSLALTLAVFACSIAHCEAQALAPGHAASLNFASSLFLNVASLDRDDAPKALSHMVTQDVFKSGSEIGSPMTKGEFVIALQRMFALPEAANAPRYTDVPANSPLGSALRAVDPYLGGHILCPGCAFGTNFMPDQPISNLYASFLTTLVLIGQNKLQPLASADAEALLATVPDAGSLPRFSRVYFATAIRGEVLPLGPEKRIGPTLDQTHGDAALLLDRVQRNFAIPEAHK